MKEKGQEAEKKRKGWTGEWSKEKERVYFCTCRKTSENANLINF